MPGRSLNFNTPPSVMRKRTLFLLSLAALLSGWLAFDLIGAGGAAAQIESPPVLVVVRFEPAKLIELKHSLKLKQLSKRDIAQAVLDYHGLNTVYPFRSVPHAFLLSVSADSLDSLRDLASQKVLSFEADRPGQAASALPPRPLAEGEVGAVIGGGLTFSSSALKDRRWRNPREAADGRDNDKNGVTDDFSGIGLREGKGVFKFTSNIADRLGLSTRAAKKIAGGGALMAVSAEVDGRVSLLAAAAGVDYALRQKAAGENIAAVYIAAWWEGSCGGDGIFRFLRSLSAAAKRDGVEMVYPELRGDLPAPGWPLVCGVLHPRPTPSVRSAAPLEEAGGPPVSPIRGETLRWGESAEIEEIPPPPAA